jgi:hypothetical protein
MAKVTGATVIGLPTGSTHFTIIKYTHTRVKQATNFWLASFIGALGSNFHYRTALNLIW